MSTKGPSAPSRWLRPGVALSAYLAAFVATRCAPPMFTGLGPTWALIAGEIGLVMLPAFLAAAIVSGRRWPATLGLNRAPLLCVLGGALVGWGWAGGRSVLLALGVTLWSSWPVRLPPSADAGLGLAAAAALGPGVCEELLFRGLLLSALAPPLAKPEAVGVSGILFTAVHASLSLWHLGLGLLLGSLSMLTGSVLPAMACHAANNAAAAWAEPLLARTAAEALPRALGEIALVSCVAVGTGVLSLVAGHIVGTRTRGPAADAHP